MKRIILFILVLFFYNCIVEEQADKIEGSEVQGKLFFGLKDSKILGNSLLLDTDYNFFQSLNLLIKNDRINPVSARNISYKYSITPDLASIPGISINGNVFVISSNVGVLKQNFTIRATPNDENYFGTVEGNLEVIIKKILTLNLDFTMLDYDYNESAIVKNIEDLIYVGGNKIREEELGEFDLSTSVGNLSKGVLKLTLDEIKNNSSIEIKVVSKKIDDLKVQETGELPSNFYSERINYYVGAKNIDTSSADIVINNHTLAIYEYFIYQKESSFLDANGNFTLESIKSSSTFKGNFLSNEKKITGLKNYQPNYVAVIRKEKTGDLKEQLLGIYSFITGAKLYWDATVPFIATNEESKWNNISSSGDNYDGVIGNVGEDFKYDFLARTFNNDDNGKNISFKEVSDIRALFLVASISDHNIQLGGHSSGIAGERMPFYNNGSPVWILGSDLDVNQRVASGAFWIGSARYGINDFKKELNKNRAYGVWLDVNATIPAGFDSRRKKTPVKIDQIKANDDSRVWKGKFQKYLIFAQNNITKNDMQRIADYLGENSKQYQ